MFRMYLWEELISVKMNLNYNQKDERQTLKTIKRGDLFVEKKVYQHLT